MTIRFKCRVPIAGFMGADYMSETATIVIPDEPIPILDNFDMRRPVMGKATVTRDGADLVVDAELINTEMPPGFEFSFGGLVLESTTLHWGHPAAIDMIHIDKFELKTLGIIAKNERTNRRL